MFAIEVELLTGRYVATHFNDRTRAEWPPHPARLFSALVATHCAVPERPVAERQALLWLERQGAPAIRASTPEEIAEREAYTVFVPVNDPDVVGTFEEEREELAAALAAASGGEGKAIAKAKALEKKLSEKVARAIGPGKLSHQGAATAASILPETRMRQPRTFPSVAPADPLVQFVWPDATPDPTSRDALAGLVTRVVRLGHSSSFIRARVIDAPAEPNWRPDDAGEHRLRVVGEGQLAALDDAFERHRETCRRSPGTA